MAYSVYYHNNRHPPRILFNRIFNKIYASLGDSKSFLVHGHRNPGPKVILLCLQPQPSDPPFLKNRHFNSNIWTPLQQQTCPTRTTLQPPHPLLPIDHYNHNVLFCIVLLFLQEISGPQKSENNSSLQIRYPMASNSQKFGLRRPKLVRNPLPHL